MGIVRSTICAISLAISVGIGLSSAAFGDDSPFHGMAYVDLEKQWNKTFNEGVTALDSNLYGKSEPLLKDAVDLAQRFGAGDARYPKSLGELGRLYTIRRRYAEAEPLFEQQLHFTEVQLGKNSGKTIPALGQMIKFYMMYGTAKKADPLAEEMLAFIDGKMREDAEQNAQAQPGKGKLLTGWAGTAPPQTHIPRMEWAVTCDRLGDLYRFKKNYDMAERFYKAGLDIKVTVMGKEHMSMAVSYDNLGILAMDKEEYRDAADYFRESLETTKKIMGNGDPDTYSRLDRLARALIKDKKYAEAESTYHTAMELWKHEPNSGGATARCLYQLGSMYCDSGNFGKAAACLGRALGISMRSSGPFAYTNVAYMRKYAYALYYCGRRGESDSLKARANWLAGSMDEPKPAVVAKPAEKPSDKGAGVTAAKPGDKTAAGKAGAVTAKGKDAADPKTAKAGDKTAKVVDKTSKASAVIPGTSTNKFNKPGMTSASETIKTMREQGKAGPMKPPSDDDPLSNPDLLSIPEEHEAPPTAQAPKSAPATSTPAAVAPSATPAAAPAAAPAMGATPPAAAAAPEAAPTPAPAMSSTPPLSEPVVAPEPHAVQPASAQVPPVEAPVAPSTVSPRSAPIPGVPVEVGKTASDEKQPKDAAQ